MRHHAFVIEAGREKGIAAIHAYIERELKMQVPRNPDVITLRYGLLSVEDARQLNETAAQAPIAGKYKALVVAANRAYHEAQNALLKLFEEPPEGTFLFLILPNLGMLLPTLRSRVQILSVEKAHPDVPKAVETFLKANREKRSTLIKKLTSGKDEEERRENRDEAIAILDGVERAAYGKMRSGKNGEETAALLSDIATLRGYLQDRGSSVRMILEHLAIVAPRDLV